MMPSNHPPAPHQQQYHPHPAQQQSSQQRTKVVAGYALQQKLGSGSFAVVYKGVKLQPDTNEYNSTNNTNNANYAAIKAISRTSEKLTPKVLQNLEVEISILRTYRHRNIVCMHEVQKTENHFYLMLEYCAGGDVQGLIRSRAARRLSEPLTRRLMRDLAAGLQFLWGQQLIHRDIKPQNLLLTGPLPLDEANDPEKTPAAEEQRRLANFPSNAFCLKIADFGFARHLQSTSLAETLCGSPLYMAPEILQHHRYDAKADLWSVGTVLFEMISGDPPFHGENHIDLLRNIQRKAVRLPKGVSVSKECVNLLRLLLSRNPLSRAGFKEFFEACNAFVALGCQGVATVDAGVCKRSSSGRGMDLGTIPENDGTSSNNSSPPPPSESLMTVATHAPVHHQQHQQQETALVRSTPPNAKSAPIPISVSANSTALVARTAHHGLSPLIPSPPSSSGMHGRPGSSGNATELPTITSNRMPQPIEMPSRRNDHELQSSTDESSFVMVEHHSLGTGTPLYQQQQPPPPPSQPHSQQPGTAMVSHYGGEMARQDPRQEDQQQQQRHSPQFHLENSPPASPSFLLRRPTPPVLSRQPPPKGMLSTSPGTGGALMGMLTGRRLQLTSNSNSEVGKQQVLETQIKAVTKMLAAAEDVGRRAISVAHLGDKRAYVAMRLVVMNESGASQSVMPMEGIEEEDSGDRDGEVTDDSSSTEIMASMARRRRSSSATDKSMSDAKAIVEEEADEMPFAVESESAPIVAAGLPSRSGELFNSNNKESGIVPARPAPKSTSTLIRSHFGEALLCYVKALKMLKGAVGAAEGVTKELETLVAKRLSAEQLNHVNKMKKRCEVTSGWLGNQFKGVLERGDAANVEISKLPSPSSSQSLLETTTVTSVEELLYNHALGCGREGAVKQLLGHYDASRLCYRSAGLLAETLLMEPGIEGEDRKTLEAYVDGFAAQITELDELMLQQSQQSRMLVGGGSSAASIVAGGSRPQLRSPPMQMNMAPFAMEPHR